MQKLPAEPAGSSAFISGREVLLAAVFLVLGGVILWFVVSDSSGPGPEEIVAENSLAPGEVAAPDPASATGDPAAQTGVSEGSGTQPATPSTSEASGAPSGASPPPAPSAAQSRAAPIPPRGAASPKTVASPPATSSPPPSRPSAQSPPRTAPSAPRPGAVGSPVAGTASSPAGSLTLNDLRIVNQAGGLQIVATTDGLPEYKLFRVENPNRVVIDMPGAWLEVPRSGRELQVSHPIVKQLRIAQNQLEPPLVRLVLEVSSFPDLQVVPRADGLVISVSGE